MTNIDPSKKTTFRFKIAVTGSKNVPAARLIVQPSKDFFFGIPAIINGDVIEVKISKKIASMFEFKSADMRLEVLVGENIFVPWNDTAKIIDVFKLEVTPLGESIEEEKETTQKAVGVTIISEEDTSEPIITPVVVPPMVPTPAVPMPAPTPVIEAAPAPAPVVPKPEDVVEDIDPESVDYGHEYSEECTCTTCEEYRERVRKTESKTDRLSRLLKR